MRMNLVSRAALSTGLMALVLAMVRPTVVAVAAPATAPITVNSTLDGADDNPGDGNCRAEALSLAAGKCSLRAAVMEADKVTGVGVTIIVPAGIFTLTISPDVNDFADKGDLNLTAPTSGDPVISIVGAGAGQTIIDGDLQDRVLSVEPGRTATISGVTLRNGYRGGGGVGGGLANDGNLTLDSSTVTGNQATGPFSEGGGIFNSNSLTVTNSTIGPNNTSYDGGGIYSLQGTVTLERSTVYGNSADDYGAGIFVQTSGNLYLINGTISQNTASTEGGAIYNSGTANVYNSTIVFNGADTDRPISLVAGGVRTTPVGTSNLRNTLLAGNYHANDFSAADCTGNINSYGMNLFGEDPPCPLLAVVDGTYAVLNSLALIGPLQDNGGPTWTHALLTGSNAIDNGDPIGGCVGPSADALATDQRGFPRVVGISCDIGAFEYLPPAAFFPLIVR